MTATTKYRHVDDLNDTLLESIFTRLIPSKHLSIARCVSKRWNSIITNPDFLRHLSREHFPLLLVLKRGYKNVCCLITEHPYFQRHKLCLDFLPIHDSLNPSINVVAYHNDLLVSDNALINETGPLKQRKTTYYIANPLTKRFTTVHITWAEANYPNPSQPRKGLWPSCVVGFVGVVNGVSTAEVTNLNDYNLGFRIVRIYSGRKLVAVIYNSETGQWTAHSFDSISFLFSCVHGVSFNDKVHWFGHSEILVVDPFDDDNVAPRFLNLPEQTLEESVLGVCRNQLQISQFKAYHKRPENPRIKVWEFTNLDDDLTTWESNKIAKLRLVIDINLEQTFIDSVIGSVYCSFGNMLGRDMCDEYEAGDRMICCHPNDPDVVFIMYRYTLLRCDVERKKLKVMVPCYLGDHYQWDEILLLVHPFLCN